MLANVDARYFRSAGPEFAAHFQRRIRFHIEHIEMARSAGEKNQNYRPWLARCALCFLPCRGHTQRRQRGQANPQQARVANLQQLAPADADRVPMSDGSECQKFFLAGRGEPQSRQVSLSIRACFSAVSNSISSSISIKPCAIVQQLWDTIPIVSEQK